MEKKRTEALVRPGEINRGARRGTYDVRVTDALTHADEHDEHDHSEHSHDHEHDHGEAHLHLEDHAELGLESYGVKLSISAPADFLARIEPVLPPGWRPLDPSEADGQFIVHMHNHAVFRVRSPGKSVSGSSDLQIALEVLDARLRNYIALHAPDHVFVHAGVVAHGGTAIVIPGPSFSGKTTLVAELVRAGARYYSDEFAVLDEQGLVHPYAKPLSMRSGGVAQVDHRVDELGGTAGEEAAPIGQVVVTTYHPDAKWDPRRLSAGEAVLALLSNTVPAQERPEQSLSTLKRALENAVAVEGERGDATALAAELLRSSAAA